jgi:hypothetical protein
MSGHKPVILTGYFTALDKFGRITLMFLQDYHGNDTNEYKKEFTKNYIQYQARVLPGVNPLFSDNKYFYIKSQKKSNGRAITAPSFIDDKPVPLEDLRGHTVECIAHIKPYDFTVDGEKKLGWSVILERISLKTP